ncbi:MAG: TIGR00296 family protein [Candidatus Heimdallarchaeota archaeon]|nr:TIGR00296 family protein [Candidatus Heimdallarchaeota archaeon]MCK5048266.1 TIGR00296 family protein [Candidatus Heimdallarchaeota archaeon]
MLSEELGKELIVMARQVLTKYLTSGKKEKVSEELLTKYPVLKEPRGVFVTLRKERGGKKTLRGCIGMPYPVKPLGEAVIESAINAAVKDPRFPKVELEELSEINLEITILTVPEKMVTEKPEDRVKEIIIGKHGLIVQFKELKGLLLPQVPVEWNWDEKKFLENTCRKASLPNDYWKREDVKFFRFEGQIFEE